MADRINERSNTAPPTRVVEFLAKLNRNRQAKVLADAAAKETKAQVTRLNGERTAIFGQAEDEGLDKEALKMLDEYSQRDEGDLNRLLENFFAYARVAEVPIYREPSTDRPQGDLWANEEERQTAIDNRVAAEAEADGCVAGLEGVDIDSNPHPVASLAHQSWAKGHAVGTADRAKRATPAASTARRPGRPPQTDEQKAAAAKAKAEAKAPPAAKPAAGKAPKPTAGPGKRKPAAAGSTSIN